ncbi:UNVERIFIED_CONTAM: hypothetical protein PYX00_007101 [Menopon gallinae]|uniref:Rho-GAP domain-containing protein n=1 Tax=Menopon gallinae TaxID=328185 RepID=A0AAW2HIG1_9NEOP
MLAEKLRNDDPEQFYTLVKMHLSFVLDLNMDESDSNTEKKFRALKWNLPFSKKPKSYSKNCFEGSHLSSEFMEQIRQLINFLSLEDNISQEGIFRRSGKVTRQQELKTLISQGIAINLNDGPFSVHDCATVLKNILSELPESVLTDAHFPAYCQIAELCNVKSVNNEDRLLKSLQLLILLLPSENRIFFQDIIALLHLAASHEDKNRMSADNLATLFTPHLLCPRKLSPEALHVNSQVMSRVVAFMIQKGTQLFEIPLTLATDLQAYWNKKERRKMSPLKQMNESVCDGTAANTVFTFVDRERTAQENGANPTETALAQLYAYIQSLPESSKKRKLIKQFNKENGHGTPLRAMGGKKRTRSRSLGDSIKKHLPVFTKNAKRPVQGINYGEEDCDSPIPQSKHSVKSRVDQACDKTKESMPALKQPLLSTETASERSGKKNDGGDDYENEDIPSLWNTRRSSQKRLTFDDKGRNEEGSVDNSNEESPRNEGFTPKKRNSSSSTENISPSKLSYNAKSETVLDQIRIIRQDVRHQWPVSSQETMMTPRSRKPVISLSGTDLCNLANMDSLTDYPDDDVSFTKPKKYQDFGKKLILEDANETNASDSLSSTFRDYLFSRSVLTTSPVDLSFSSRTDDFLSLSDSESSAENEDFKSLAGSILNENALSDSLLYCLDGNEPGSNDSSGIAENGQKGSKCSSVNCSEDSEDVNHVYETAL